jgi:hypothetical protein
VPLLLCAVTEHVYVFFNVALATVMSAAVAPLCTPILVVPPLLERHVAVYPVIAKP